MNHHTLTIQDILHLFSTSLEGLTEKQAKEILGNVGPNILPQGKKRTIFVMIGDQLKSTLVWVLIAAAALSAFLQHSYIDSLVILIIVVLNTAIGVVQEFKTEKTLENLRSLLNPQARVIRNKELQIVAAMDIVPGDILLLDEWERIVADARVIKTAGLHMNQAILTGESVSQEKTTDALWQNIPLSDRCNMVYQWTTVSSGSGRAVVISTWANTELGHISWMVQQITEEMNPFSQKLEEFSRKIAIFVTCLCIILVAILIFSGGSLSNSILVAVSLAVSAIPEWLPAVVALWLAFATKRLVKKNVLVRKLPASETLGRVTIICTDKTGTLTKSEMQVVEIYTNWTSRSTSDEWRDEEGEKVLLELSVWCNKAWYGRDASGWEQLFGDPTEIGLLQFAEWLGCKKSVIESEYPVIIEFPFDSDRKRMSIVRNNGTMYRSYVKGAPERIMELVTFELLDEQCVPLTEVRKKELYTVFTQYARDGRRVLAMAYRDITKIQNTKHKLQNNIFTIEQAESDLVFVGFTAIMDPPRAEVAPAIAQCLGAGIRVIMITWDSELTAAAVGSMIGLAGETMDATKLSQLSDDELCLKLTQVNIFSRIAPQDKLRIIRLLKSQWHIVAMTGDGVNDALALKQADIGISMGIRWTDVARDASDMVLLDDNFASIVAGVEEGRRVYDNTKKFIKYLLACNFYEVFLLVWAVLVFQNPNIVPFIAIQILWINLVTDSFPALALSTQSSERNVMQRKPVNESLLSGIQWFIVISGFIGFFVIWTVFLMYYKEDLPLAQTLAITTSVVYQMLRSLSCGRVGAFDLRVNKWLFGAVGLSLLLHFALLASPLGQHFWFVLISTITGFQFLLILGLPVLWYIVGELTKGAPRS